MRALHALFQGPGLSGALTIGDKSGAVVDHAQADLAASDGQANVDAVGAAMAHGIGDSLAEQLLEIELEPQRDRHLLALRSDLAIDRPLLAEPFGKGAKLGDGLAKLKVAMLAKRHDKATDLALLLDEQALELVEVALHRGP